MARNSGISRTATSRGKRRGAVIPGGDERGEFVVATTVLVGHATTVVNERVARRESDEGGNDTPASGRPIELDNSQFNAHQSSLKTFSCV